MGNVRVYPPTDRAFLRLMVNGQDWSTRIRSGMSLMPSCATTMHPFFPMPTTATDYSEEVIVNEEDDVTVYLPSETKGGVEAQDGTVIIVTTPDLDVVVSLETEGVLHLDVQARTRSQDLMILDGVLGQTFLWQIPLVEKILATPDEDFGVQGGLSGVQCSTCSFVPRMTPQQVAQYRRKLLSETGP